MKRSCNARGGFVFTADVIFALAIVAAMGIVLAVAVGRERNAAIHLADSRAAQRLAEHVLLDLQYRQTVVAPGPSEKIDVRRIDDGEAPAGYSWASVKSTVRGKKAELVGLVPDVALPKIGTNP